MQELLATLFHLWKNYPIRIEPTITLVALSVNMAIDLVDVQRIKMDREGDYEITYKSTYQEDIVFAGTPEFEALQLIMATLNKKEQ